jgi:chitin disaccharide deacetylase
MSFLSKSGSVNEPLTTSSSDVATESRFPPQLSGSNSVGSLILNADDWGRTKETTNRIFDCISRGTVSSVSAMVLMEDSERAAEISRHRGVDAGLHLNLTTPFTAPKCTVRLTERQREVAAYLRRHAGSRVIYHPWLAQSFEYVVAAQVDEFRRVYNADPNRIDGHHHMHLCANVLLAGLLPSGTIARRHFSFEPGEKRLRNGVFRQLVNLILPRRHRTADFFFSLSPLESSARLQRIFSLARQFTVEIETHPVHQDEYRFLMGDGILRLTRDINIAHRYAMPISP